MATYEKNGQLTYVDENNNEYILYPKTTVDQVIGFGTNNLPVLIGDPENITKTGMYLYNNSLGSTGAPVVYGIIDAVCHERFRFLRLYSFDNAYLAFKICSWGNWTDWLWEMPAMDAGHDYRTTKYLDGKTIVERLNSSTGVLQYKIDGEVAYNDYAKLYGAFPSIESTDYPGCYYRERYGVIEWVNPPLVVGVEYRTTKRYNGVAVYEKVDANGNVLWRSENESTWHLLASAEHIAAATVE